MTTQITNLNLLNFSEKGIWSNRDNDCEFGYSDGVDEEQYLVNILKNTEDLSLDSAQLREASVDWVAAYHLSAERANLLKSINLPAYAKVLEVGCGCGAVTRYLGEKGFLVDAVEGSAARAEISALRCRDLDNVQIIEHNFNTLKLPQHYYDVVLFVGVLEYARRFIDDSTLTAEQAVSTLVNKAASSLSDNGLIIAAIENRMGFKYLNGAYEDHLALPDVGVNGYQDYEYTGIKTYDRSQWQTIIKACGLKHRLFFPFADYKFPTLVINGEINDDEVDFLSNQIESRDPISPWQRPIKENEQWSRIIKSGDLSEYSNSYGLIIGKSQHDLENTFNNHWTLFDKVEIKPELRLNITNEQSNNYINNKEIKQIIDKLHCNQNTLNEVWRQGIAKQPSVDTLTQLTHKLTSLLERHWPQQKLVDFDQIFISNNEQQLNFCKVWKTPIQVSLEQQLFHYLLGFCSSNQKFLSVYPAFNCITISCLLRRCLNHDTVSYAKSIDQLVNQEQLFRNQVHISPCDVKDDLQILLSKHDKYAFRYITAQIFYSSQADIFAADQSISKRLKQSSTVRSIAFNGICSNTTHLRFDPCDHEYGLGHSFCIHSITITNPDNTSIMQWQNKAIAEILTGHHDLDIIDERQHIYKVDGIDPQIKFSLPLDLTKITDRYNVEIKLQWLGV